jgi:phage replication initiation protein
MLSNSTPLELLDNPIFEKPKTNSSAVFVDLFKIRFDDMHDLSAGYCHIDNLLRQNKMRISGKNIKPSPNYGWGYQIVAGNDDTKTCGAVQFSEFYNRIILNLPGTGCAMVESCDPGFDILDSLAQQPNTYLMRVDLAHDDYLGNASIAKVDRDYSRGLYDPHTGKRPIKISDGNHDKGRTRYIGGRTAYKKLIAYEKGKQLNLHGTEYGAWFRNEVRLTSNSRDRIPSEVISCRDDYFFSAFPKAMRKLIGSRTFLPVTLRSAIESQADLGKTLIHARKQYGPAVKHSRDRLGDERTLDLLSRDAVRDRYSPPSFVTQEMLQATVSVITSMFENEI